MATVAELLVRIGADNSEFERAVRRTERSVDKMGKKLTKTGETLTKSITVPLLGAGLAAGMFASDTESATGKIQAQLGTTAEEAQKLGDIAEAVWEGAFGENLDEVAGALTTVKRNMQGVADTDLKAITESAFILSDVFGADINQSTKTASTLMKNFRVSGQKAFDLMTVGFQKGGDFSGELLDTLNEYAPQFADLGLSAEDAMNLLISGAQNGAFNLDKVGDAVKEFNVRATDGSKTTAEGFARLGLDAELFAQKIAEGGPAAEGAFQTTLAALASIKDPLEQDRAGVALFGTQWEDLSGKVVTAMTSTVDQLGVVDGATQAAGDAFNDNFGTKLTELWRNAQSALEPLGIILIDLAEEWLPKVTGALEKVAGGFSNLSPGIQKVIVIVGMVVAAIGPLLIAFGFIISAVGAMIPVLAFLVSPIGLIIAAVVLLAILIIANWETIKTVTITVWNAIADFFVTLWEGIKSVLTTAWEGIKQFFIDYWPLILGIFTGGLGLLVGLLIANWDKIKSVTIKIWDATMKWLGKTWNNLVSFGKKAFKELWKGIKAVFFSLLKGGVIGLVNDFILKPFFDIDLFKIGKDLIQGFWDGIQSMAEWVKTKVKQFVEGIGDTIKNFFGIASPSKLMQEYGRFIADGLAQGIEESTGKVANAANNMSQAVTGALSQINDKLSLAVDITKTKFELFKAQMGSVASEGTLLKHHLDSLNETLEIQRDRVSIATQAYADMKTAKGEAATETQRLYLNLLQEQKVLADIQNEIQGVTEKLIQANAAKKEWVVTPFGSSGGGGGGGSGSGRGTVSDANGSWSFEGSREQFEEFASGGSRNTGGSYTVDFRDFNPTPMAVGTNFVPRDMFAMLHEGEAVVPKKYNNNQGNGGPVTIIVEMDGREIARGTAPHIVREIRLKTGLVT